MKMRNRCFVYSLLLMLVPIANAHEIYLTSARLVYPSIVGTSLDSCSLCHSNAQFDRNSYGADYGSHSHSFANIEGLDSDDDTFSNKTEIDALTFPGNANSFPTVSASIKVKKPNGGETWTLGSKAKVTWTSTGDVGTDVTIELWQNGQKVGKLKGSTPNDGKQNVKLKPTKIAAGTGYTVKVKSVSNPSISDESNAGFTIVDAP